MILLIHSKYNIELSMNVISDSRNAHESTRTQVYSLFVFHSPTVYYYNTLLFLKMYKIRGAQYVFKRKKKRIVQPTRVG